MTGEFHQMLEPTRLSRLRILDMGLDVVMETPQILAPMFPTGIRMAKVLLDRVQNFSSIRESKRYLSSAIRIFMAGPHPPMHPYLILNPKML
jgi:hypothetical protein